MKQKRKPFYQVMLIRFTSILFLFGLGIIIASGNQEYVSTITNMNGVKSIEAIKIISKYDNRNQVLEVRHVSSMQEAALYGPDGPISFTGQMTAYNPVCRGCTGKVYCPPRQDVTKGNIYYNDETYGSIRILAADPAIPCGTIVKISNVSFSNEDIIGIVLDRGGAIKGNIMDFLVTETYDMNIVGRQKNVNYEILRWGW